MDTSNIGGGMRWMEMTIQIENEQLLCKEQKTNDMRTCKEKENWLVPPTRHTDGYQEKCDLQSQKRICVLGFDMR